MGSLTPNERRLIDEALTRIPVKERRVPAGASAFAVDYKWDGKKLVDVTPVEDRAKDRGSYRGQPIARAKARKRMEIADDIRAGMTLEQIREKHHITADLVKSVANIFGIEIAREGDAPTSAAARLTARIVVAANGQRDALAIAKIVGCGADEVRARRDALGLNIPRRAGQGVAA